MTAKFDFDIASLSKSLRQVAKKRLTNDLCASSSSVTTCNANKEIVRVSERLGRLQIFKFQIAWCPEKYLVLDFGRISAGFRRALEGRKDKLMQ